MRILIFGASGGTGRLLVERALDRGHEVTAVARSVAVPDQPRAGLTPCPVDVHDTAALHRATEGHDAALSVIGGPVKHHGNIYSTGTGNIVNALEAASVRRFVCVSSGGVRPDDRGLPPWYRLAIPLFMRSLYQDMRVMERIVRDSALDWTLVRSSYLVDKPPRGRFRVEDDQNPPGGWKITRADLAEFLLDQLDSGQWLKARPTIAF